MIGLFGLNPTLEQFGLEPDAVSSSGPPVPGCGGLVTRGLGTRAIITRGLGSGQIDSTIDVLVALDWTEDPEPDVLPSSGPSIGGCGGLVTRGMGTRGILTRGLGAGHTGSNSDLLVELDWTEDPYLVLDLLSELEWNEDDQPEGL